MNNTAINLATASILVVDDNQTNIDVIEATLESAGYENIVAVTQPLDLMLKPSEIFKQ